MSETKEVRFTAVTVEARAEAEKRTIGGYAAKFNRLSQNLGGFVERIAPGFFNSSRADGWPDVFARDNHDDVLASAAAGTLRLSIDDTGLVYDADLEADVVSQRVWLQVKAGNYRGSSFAFAATEEDWGVTEQGFPMRTLVSGLLYDVSPVVTPAYRDTSAAARSIDSALGSLASKFDADPAEIRALAAENQLIKLFKRSDETPAAPKSISSQEAVARALARKR
jgi:HK97 family phage prohead protease